MLSTVGDVCPFLVTVPEFSTSSKKLLYGTSTGGPETPIPFLIRFCFAYTLLPTLPNNNKTVSVCIAISTFPFLESDLNLAIIFPGVVSKLTNTFRAKIINDRARCLLFRGFFSFDRSSSREENNRVADDDFIVDCPYCLECDIADKPYVEEPYTEDCNLNILKWNPSIEVGKSNIQSKKIRQIVFIFDNSRIMPSTFVVLSVVEVFPRD